MPRSSDLRRSGELTLEEVATILGVHYRTALSLCHASGDLPSLTHIERSGCYFVAKDELEAFRAAWPTYGHRLA